MTGHTSEKRWHKNQTPTCGKGLSEEVTELSQLFLDILYRAEKLGLELDELIDYVDPESKDIAQDIANQLFKENWEKRESDPIGDPGIFDDYANENEVSKVRDAISAVAAAKEIFEFANDASDRKSRISKMRRMA